MKLALMAMAGEMGYDTALSAPGWGFESVWFGGNAVTIARPFDSYVMENILFKISFPAEFHAQTAVEAAMDLYEEVGHRIDEVETVKITTQEPAMRIIKKEGPLTNPADRDHCLQYMVAVPLIKGELVADDYEDDAAADPRIDALRARMQVVENPRYTRDYLDPEKRSIANAVQVFFAGGESTREVAVEYPIGHRRRRDEGIPLLWGKFESNLRTRFSADRAGTILATCRDSAALDEMPIDEFIDLFAP